MRSCPVRSTLRFVNFNRVLIFWPVASSSGFAAWLDDPSPLVGVEAVSWPIVVGSGCSWAGDHLTAFPASPKRVPPLGADCR